MGQARWFRTYFHLISTSETVGDTYETGLFEWFRTYLRPRRPLETANNTYEPALFAGFRTYLRGRRPSETAEIPPESTKNRILAVSPRRCGGHAIPNTVGPNRALFSVPTSG